MRSFIKNISISFILLLIFVSLPVLGFAQTTQTFAKYVAGRYMPSIVYSIGEKKATIFIFGNLIVGSCVSHMLRLRGFEQNRIASLKWSSLNELHDALAYGLPGSFTSERFKPEEIDPFLVKNVRKFVEIAFTKDGYTFASQNLLTFIAMYSSLTDWTIRKSMFELSNLDLQNFETVVGSIRTLRKILGQFYPKSIEELIYTTRPKSLDETFTPEGLIYNVRNDFITYREAVENETAVDLSLKQRVTNAILAFNRLNQLLEHTYNQVSDPLKGFPHQKDAIEAAITLLYIQEFIGLISIEDRDKAIENPIDYIMGGWPKFFGLLMRRDFGPIEYTVEYNDY